MMEQNALSVKTVIMRMNRDIAQKKSADLKINMEDVQNVTSSSTLVSFIKLKMTLVFKNVVSSTPRQMMMNALLTVQMVGIKISMNAENAMFKIANIVTMMVSVQSALKERYAISHAILFQKLQSMTMKLRVNVSRNAYMTTNMRLTTHTLDLTHLYVQLVQMTV